MDNNEALSDLEFNIIRTYILELFNAKLYHNEEIAVLRNVILLRNTYDYYKIVQNNTLPTLLRKDLTDDLKIEITLSMLDTDEEKLTRLEQLIRG